MLHTPKPWRVAVWARVRYHAVQAIVAASVGGATSPADGLSPWVHAWTSKDAEAVASRCTIGADVADAIAAACLPPCVPAGAPLLDAIAGRGPGTEPLPAFLDFDGTLTTRDTTANVLEAAARAALASGGTEAETAARSGASAASERFAKGYAKHSEAMRKILNDKTRLSLATALLAADAFDTGAAAEVEDALVMQGTRPSDLRAIAAEQVSLADATLQCLASLRGSTGLDTRVLSASLGGAAFIRAALQADSSLAVRAPELAAPADGAEESPDVASTGRFESDPPPTQCAGDKLQALLKAVGMEERVAGTLADPAADANRAIARAVMVGDSMGDIRALLCARVGLLAVPPPDTSVLHAALKAAHAPLRPLLSLASAAVTSTLASLAPPASQAGASPASSLGWPIFMRSSFGRATLPCVRSAALLELVALVCGADEVLRCQGLSDVSGLPHGATVPPRVLAVAGSDSGGGAGIQADIKAATALGAFVTTALTSVTAQNTKGVQAVHVVPILDLQLQLASVLSDVGADAVKTGLLPNADAVEATAAAVESVRRAGSPGSTTGRAVSPTDCGVQGKGADAVWMRELCLPSLDHSATSAPSADPSCGEDLGTTACAPWLVVDPVMVAASGHRFVDDETMKAIRTRLLPLATICTPNVPEAEALLGRELVAELGDPWLEAVVRAARDIAAMGSTWVLLKGGHAPGVLDAPASPGLEAVDVLVHGATGRAWAIGGAVVSTRNTHGTGCTLASAIAAGLAKGRTVPGAVLAARRYLAEALHRSAALAVGKGEHGPVNHAFQLARWTAGSAAPRDGASTRDALRVYAVTDPHLLAGRRMSVGDAVAAAVKGGATMVQVRDKEAPTGALIATVRQAVHAARAAAGGPPFVPVIVNDRADVALAAGADGLHVGQSDMSILDARRVLGHGAIIGVTVSNAEQARLAVSQGADYLGTDPVFATPTKTDSATIGMDGLGAIVSAAGPVPVVAIGGLNASNIADVLVASGAAGVAVVSAVFGSDDIASAARMLRSVVDGARERPGRSAAAAASAASCPGCAVESVPEAAATEPFAIPPFAKSCLDAAGSSWSASFTHPFVLGLADGTLDSDKFKFYQMQDARYLESFADACAYVAARCPEPDDKAWFLRAATLALEVERSLHLDFGTKLGYTPADIAALELTPNAKAYGDHMVQSAMRAPLVEAVAALAPCPWLYTDLGAHLARTYGPPADDHPYAAWLRTYADDSFSEYMGNLLSRMERFAGEASESVRARARAAFATSSKYEYMFWAQAWEMQTWPV